MKCKLKELNYKLQRPDPTLLRNSHDPSGWAQTHPSMIIWQTMANQRNPEIDSKSRLRPHIFTIYILIVVLKSFYSGEKVSNTRYSIFGKHGCLFSLQDFPLLISLKLNCKQGNVPNASSFSKTIIINTIFTKTVLVRWLLLVRWLWFKAQATLTIQIAQRRSGLSAMITAG